MVNVMMKSQNIIDVAVIGGGAAGMTSAISAAESGADVLIIEKNRYTGRKIGITGKGRCNVTNNCTAAEFLENVRTNPKFLWGAAAKFSPSDAMAMFEGAGVKLKTERGRRVFPVSDKAADIQFAFERMLKKSGVRVMYDSPVSAVEAVDEGPGESVKPVYRITAGERTVLARAVIFATGGVSYPLTGSTGDGHRILAGLGVKVTPLKPSLVPIVTAEDYSSLSGLSLKNVTLTVVDKKGGEVYSEMGEMLFTHFGVSGPLVLSASSNMQKYEPNEYKIYLNMKPALSREELDRRVLSDLKKYSAKDFVNSLGDLLPQKMIKLVVERSGIFEHKKSGEITREERGRLLDALTRFEIGVKSFRPIEEAIVTCGGVDVRELNPKTMGIKSHPGLYAAGELIDVDAYTGGYNLQIAYCTGYLAGKSAAEFALSE